MMPKSTFALKLMTFALALQAFSVSAYTDTEFAFKVAAERKLKEKIVEYLAQAIPVEDFKITVSASVFALEPDPAGDAPTLGEPLENVYTDGDPEDLSLGVVQSRDIRDALRGRDALIEKLRLDLSKAKAPLHQGVEILQLSVWLGIRDTYTAERAATLKNQLSMFLAETYRITPKVFLQKLAHDEIIDAPNRTLASEPSVAPDNSSFKIPAWIYVILAISLLLSALAFFARTRGHSKETEIIRTRYETEPKTHPDHDAIAPDTQADEAPSEPSEIEPIEHMSLAEARSGLDEVWREMKSHLKNIKVSQVEKIVQFWAEGDPDAHYKATVVLKNWAEIMPDAPISCPLGSEVFGKFSQWKDLSVYDQLKYTEAALWELSAVTSMGVQILGTTVSRVDKLFPGRVQQLMQKLQNPTAVYVLWSLLVEEQRRPVLMSMSPKFKSKLFDILWSHEEGFTEAVVQKAILEIEAVLDANSAADRVDTERMVPGQMRKTFVTTLDARNEIELLWPSYVKNPSFIDEFRDEHLNLTTLAYLKDEFWTLPDLVPTEDEFISLAKLLGTQAYVHILAAMPSLTRHIYESSLRAKLIGFTKPAAVDFANADSYLARIKIQLVAQQTKISDIVQADTCWPIESLGFMGKSNQESGYDTDAA